jgi:hypothetical protein
VYHLFTAGDDSTIIGAVISIIKIGWFSRGHMLFTRNSATYRLNTMTLEEAKRIISGSDRNLATCVGDLEKGQHYTQLGVAFKKLGNHPAALKSFYFFSPICACI